MSKQDSENQGAAQEITAKSASGADSTRPAVELAGIYKNLAKLYDQIDDLLDESQVLKHEYRKDVANDDGDHVSVTLLEARDTLSTTLNNLAKLIDHLTN
jgi:hypothetical protein